MTFTKVTNTGIGSTGTVLLQNLDVIGVTTVGGGVSAVNGFFSGITTFANATDSTSTTTGSVIVSGGVGIAGSLNVGGSVSVGGTLTYEDVTNVDSVGIITARSNILVGSGITLSPDGDIFTTGISTFNNDVNIGTAGKLIISGNAAAKSIEYGDGTTTGYFVSNTNVNRANADAAIHLQQFRWNNTKVAEMKVLTGDDTTNKDNAHITFETASAGTTGERLRITSAGEVGIGLTNPAGLLHLSSGTSGDCELILESDTDNNNEYDNPKILFRQDGGYDQSCVGIGGTTDDSAIHNALTLRNSAASASGIIFMTNSVAGEGHLSAVERLRIHSTGAFGLSGTNYGSDNQALTSKGSSSPPEWRGVNTPAWDSYQSSATSIPTGAWTLIAGLTQLIDTDAAFASSTFVCPAGGAGTYFVYGIVTIDDIQAADYIIAAINKKASGEASYGDPSTYHRGFMNTAGSSNARIGSVVNCMITLAEGDSLRLTCLHNEGTTEPTEPTYTRFGGYRLSI